MKERKKRLSKVLIFILCLIGVYIFAIIGSLLTAGETSSAWYESSKPATTPPNYVFPIVWNILFVMIALSIFFALTSSKTEKDKTKVYSLFAINLILNVIWSLLFFKLKNPSAAFIELIILWFSILALIIGMWKISRVSSYLLIPYFLWVSFAGVLNFLFL